ncbi:MAG TPA: M23 family metallopeptidase, partial [Candidatus Eisenbacteria bacterium]|nr:M23 family metallopeptidase [Candidatus Eisenbacteria bacterium]
AAAEAPAPELAPRFPRMPLAAPLALTSGYGDVRGNHFHAGVDLSTRSRVGAEVLAPAAGWVERVHTSGAGYGRVVYLRLEDGRLLVFGHLDAFAPALAAYVDSAQRADGQYDQDLWPAARRFRFAAGERLAWSGESGTGAPHLHFEVRHGDFALDPLRAGLEVSDHAPPRLVSLTLEPLDERSYVARGAAPLTRRLGARAETLVVEGRVRAVVKAVDGGADGRPIMPCRVGLAWGGLEVTARLDSISWADDMAQVDLVMDRGRVTFDRPGEGPAGVILWSPARQRPRFIAAPGPDSVDAGAILVAPGDPPRPLRLWAEDAAGHAVARSVWLRGPRAGEAGPDTLHAGTAPRAHRHGRRARAAAAAEVAEPGWTFGALPDRRLRVRVTGAPAGLTRVRIERARVREDISAGSPATWDGAGWCAVLYVSGIPDEEGFWIKGRLPDGRAWWSRGPYQLWPAGTLMLIQADATANTGIGAGQVFENDVALTRMWAAGAPGEDGLVPVAAAMELLPATLPLKHPIPIVLTLPAGMSPSRVGIYHRAAPEGPWDFLGARFDSSAHAFTGEAATTGEFGLLRDDTPPAVRVRPPARRAPAGPYPRWELAA